MLEYTQLGSGASVLQRDPAADDPEEAPASPSSSGRSSQCGEDGCGCIGGAPAQPATPIADRVKGRAKRVVFDNTPAKRPGRPPAAAEDPLFQAPGSDSDGSSGGDSSSSSDADVDTDGGDSEAGDSDGDEGRAALEDIKRRCSQQHKDDESLKARQARRGSCPRGVPADGNQRQSRAAQRQAAQPAQRAAQDLDAAEDEGGAPPAAAAAPEAAGQAAEEPAAAAASKPGFTSLRTRKSDKTDNDTVKGYATLEDLGPFVMLERDVFAQLLDSKPRCAVTSPSPTCMYSLHNMSAWSHNSFAA